MLGNFEESGNKVAVTLYQNNLSKENEYFGMVSKNNANINNIVAGIADKNPAFDPNLIYHISTLFINQVLNEIKQGHGADLGPLGNLNFALSDTVKGPNPEVKDIPAFELRYSPSDEVKMALSYVSPDIVSISDVKPAIKDVEDLISKNINDSLKPGGVCRIKGKMLKLNIDSDLDSIDFIKVSQSGDIIPDCNPISVDKNKIFKNTDRRLEFFVPDSLDSEAFYKIRITSTFLKSGLSRKTPISGESIMIKINI